MGDRCYASIAAAPDARCRRTDGASRHSRRSAGTSARYCPGRGCHRPPSQFPVLDRARLPQRGHVRAAAARARCTRPPSVPRGTAVEGRTREYLEPLLALRDRQRAAYAERLGADPADVALTTSHERGRRAASSPGSTLGPGDEILTAPERAPGPARPAASAARAARRRRPDRAVRRRSPTRSARARASSRARTSAGSPARSRPRRSPRPACPCVLDGAQGVGAVPVDVARAGLRVLRRRRARSGCAGRTAPGCSGSPPPGASGCAPIGRDVPQPRGARRRPRQRRCTPTRAATTRRRSRAEASPPRVAAHEVLGAGRLGRGVRAAARAGRRRWPSASRERGRDVAPRGDTTLVVVGGRRP